MSFRDRSSAGRLLAERLEYLRGSHVVVLGLPRGGVPVAFEVARALGAPLDVMLVRKLGVPWQPELAMGAIAEGGVRILNDEVLAGAGLSSEDVGVVERRERAELERRAVAYRGSRPRIDLTGRVAVVVDDGIATGATVRAACVATREHGAARVVLAVPVAPPETVRSLGTVADEVVVLLTPTPLIAVGAWYDDFGQTSDDEVRDLLAAVR